MRFMKSPLIIVSIFTVLSGCSKDSSKSNSEAPKSIPAANSKTAARLETEGKTTEAAAEYARVGELLMMPEGAEHADKMLDKALELDPKNSKAIFYSAFTKPLLKFKGFVTRLRGISESDDLQHLDDFEKQLKKDNLNELRNLLTVIPNGQAPFATYNDLQRFMKNEVLPEVLKSVDKINMLVGKNDVELYINLARLGFPGTKMKYESHCYSSQYDSTPYQTTVVDNNGRMKTIEKQNTSYYWDCSYYSTAKLDDIMKSEHIILDASDIKVLRGSFMAWADSIRLSTAYNVNGLREAIHALHLLNDEMQTPYNDHYTNYLTTRDVIKELAKHQSLFTIERDQELINLARSQEAVLRDALSLGELKEELCGNAARHDGMNLIKSFCITTNGMNDIQNALDMLAGPKPLRIGNDEDGNQVDVVFNVPALISNPPADIKKLFPTTFDKRGEARRWKDVTFGGLIPNGDLVEAIADAAAGSRISGNDHPLAHVHQILHPIQFHKKHDRGYSIRIQQ